MAVEREKSDGSSSRDFAPIGTVIASVLPPVEFAKAGGEVEGAPLDKRTWILADGRSVIGTKYAKLTGDQPIPNFQGMFLRGIDVSTSRKPGSVEGHATALPVASRFVGQTSVAGDHVHSGGAGFGNDRYEAGGDDYRAVGATQTGAAGSHHHVVEITGGGDSETRPKNVAVYYYIKIN
ncbi:hypothetical protein HFO27_32805 [Rhizobium leguminosarum]|uniref:hypothetical protein n=1 Tax=Rhizobium leguminosarum TaxID=384 RepID=UPI001C926D6F|nr:hypothetical protein [Rhizobium leguminosarum]MBY3179324.1 hypothetical protein [Rhizobium leguminosarum]